jgi:hypothetical protein
MSKGRVTVPRSPFDRNFPSNIRYRPDVRTVPISTKPSIAQIARAETKVTIYLRELSLNGQLSVTIRTFEILEKGVVHSIVLKAWTSLRLLLVVRGMQRTESQRVHTPRALLRGSQRKGNQCIAYPGMRVNGQLRAIWSGLHVEDCLRGWRRNGDHSSHKQLNSAGDTLL